MRHKRLMKKLMLISCPPQSMDEVYLPLIHQFSDEFRVIVVITDYFVPPGLLDHLKFLEEKGIIEKHFLIPDPKGSLQFFLSMRKTLEGLCAYPFDVWLTCSEKHLEYRYIAECLLPKNCLRVLLWHNVTYLLKNESLSRLLLGEGEEKHVSVPVGVRFVDKVKNSKSILEVVRKTPHFLMRPIKKINKDFKYNIYRHIILPKLFLRKSFRRTSCDDLTEIGSGRSHVVMFCDEMEAKAHQPLFKNSEVLVAQYPTNGLCHCQGDQQKIGTILSPLSGFCGLERISEENLFLYYRDLHIVVKQTGAKKIHLRLHPQETGGWPYQLEDYLKKRGLNVKTVSSERPLRAIVCDYLGVAGFASSSLRDCRSTCHHIFVIGFAAISKYWTANPKFAFGKSEGIDWIEEDGSYSPDIFKRKRYFPPTRKSVLEIIREKLGANSL